jgi:cysteine desulfurase
MENPVYLDYNATTPIDHEVKEAMQPFLENFFGNPSSTHIFGVQTRKAVEKARARVADLVTLSSRRDHIYQRRHRGK